MDGRFDDESTLAGTLLSSPSAWTASTVFAHFPCPQPRNLINSHVRMCCLLEDCSLDCQGYIGAPFAALNRKVNVHLPAERRTNRPIERVAYSLRWASLPGSARVIRSLALVYSVEGHVHFSGCSCHLLIALLGTFPVTPNRQGIGAFLSLSCAEAHVPSQCLAISLACPCPHTRKLLHFLVGCHFLLSPIHCSQTREGHC